MCTATDVAYLDHLGCLLQEGGKKGVWQQMYTNASSADRAH